MNGLGHVCLSSFIAQNGDLFNDYLFTILDVDALSGV